MCLGGGGEARGPGGRGAGVARGRWRRGGGHRCGPPGPTLDAGRAIATRDGDAGGARGGRGGSTGWGACGGQRVGGIRLSPPSRDKLPQGPVWPLGVGASQGLIKTRPATALPCRNGVCAGTRGQRRATAPAPHRHGTATVPATTPARPRHRHGHGAAPSLHQRELPWH